MSKIYLMRYAMAGSFGPYLAFGFIFVLVGTVVAYSSVGMIQNGDSFGSASVLPNSATTLFVGGFILLVGLLLMLVGLLSSTHKHSVLYY